MVTELVYEAVVEVVLDYWAKAADANIAAHHAYMRHFFPDDYVEQDERKRKAEAHAEADRLDMQPGVLDSAQLAHIAGLNDFLTRLKEGPYTSNEPSEDVQMDDLTLEYLAALDETEMDTDESLPCMDQPVLPTNLF